MGAESSVVPAVSVVLPAHNEEDMLQATVGDIIDGLRIRGGSFEVIVVENGSTDATAAIAEGLAGEHPEVRSFRSDEPDYGKALRRGLLASTGEVVVNFDVDYYDLGFLDIAVEAVRAGAGVVVGSKRGAGAQDDRPVSRRLVTAGFAFVLRAGFGLRASDTHGMKALDRARLVPLAERCVLGKDLFDTELVLRAERGGLEVREIPVHVEERRPARSSILRRIVRTPLGLVKLWRALRV